MSPVSNVKDVPGLYLTLPSPTAGRGFYWVIFIPIPNADPFDCAQDRLAACTPRDEKGALSLAGNHSPLEGGVAEAKPPGAG